MKTNQEPARSLRSFDDLRKPPFCDQKLIKWVLDCQKDNGQSAERTMLELIDWNVETHRAIDRGAKRANLPPHREMELVRAKEGAPTAFSQRAIGLLPGKLRGMMKVREPTRALTAFKELSKPYYRSMRTIKEALAAQKRFGYSPEETMLLMIENYANMAPSLEEHAAKIRPLIPPIEPPHFDFGGPY